MPAEIGRRVEGRMRVRLTIFVMLALLLFSCQESSSTARKSKVQKTTTKTATATVSTSPSLSQQQIISDAEASTVHITGRLGSGYVFGTGVVIDAAQGWILTNAHVISGT